MLASWISGAAMVLVIGYLSAMLIDNWHPSSCVMVVYSCFCQPASIPFRFLSNFRNKKERGGGLPSLRVTYFRVVIRVPVDPDKQPAVCQEPQALVRRRQRNRLAYTAERNLAGCRADGKSVAGPLADHVLQTPSAVRVAIFFDPRYAAENPGFHAKGEPRDEEEVVQLEEKVKGARWVEGAGCEERDLGGVGFGEVFVGGVGCLRGCRVWT